MKDIEQQLRTALGDFMRVASGQGDDYSSDVLTEIARFVKKSGKAIIPLTVREILDEQIAKKLA